jgi:hypothetical protein
VLTKFGAIWISVGIFFLFYRGHVGTSNLAVVFRMNFNACNPGSKVRQLHLLVACDAVQEPEQHILSLEIMKMHIHPSLQQNNRFCFRIAIFTL